MIIPFFGLLNKHLVNISEDMYYPFMMHITLLTVGKCRHAGFRAAAQDYAQRLKHYAVFSETEIREERATIPVSEVLRKEGERLLQAIPSGAYVVVLDPEGQPCASEAFAKCLSNLALQGKNRLIFVIGSAFGLSPEVRHRASWILSLSAMTLPHELARVLILEQIYRAYTIMRGENYHK